MAPPVINPADPAPQTNHLPESVIEAAIAWAIKLDYHDNLAPETRQSFDRWLHADPLHALAWQRVHSLKHFKNDYGSIPSRLALDTLQALDTKRQARKLNRRNVIKLLSLGGVTVAAGWITREYTPWQRLLADVSTVVGEQKTLWFADGTLIMLNTDSAISTDFSGDRRLVILRRGEILVSTGADAAISARIGQVRPFWIHTPFGKLQALGTRFVVRLDHDRARVSVQEGMVELHPTAGSVSAIVQAGESRWLTEDSTAPTAIRPFEEDDWANGVISGKNMRLADLVAELSRYRSGYIVCDERVADWRVSGIFHVKDTDQALQFLAQTQPVSVTYRTRFWVIIGPEDENR